MIPKEQIKQLKEQLIKQLENFPEEQRASMEEQIEEMNDGEFEEFLIKNNMIRTENNGQNSPKESPFRMIVEGKIPSYKIAENKFAIAVLEINPISIGHTLIIPKKQAKIEELPLQAFTLARKISKLIKEKLKCKKTDIATSEVFNEGIIQVLPVYESEHLGMPRKKASEQELKEVQEKLSLKKIKKVKEKKSKEDSREPEKKLPKAPVRIP